MTTALSVILGVSLVGIVTIIILFFRGLKIQKDERIECGREKCSDCKYKIETLNSGFTACKHPKNEYYMSSSMIEMCKFKEKKK